MGRKLVKLTVPVILLIAAVICFVLAAVRVRVPIDFQALGFAFVVASWIAA
jgi:hypothetical protein